jgi:hypothetical protein
MHPMILTNLVDRLDPTDRLQAYFRLEGRRVALALRFTHLYLTPSLRRLA